MDNLIGKKAGWLIRGARADRCWRYGQCHKAVSLGQNGPVPAGTVVAVKVLREEFVHDPDLVHRFKNESKATRC